MDCSETAIVVEPHIVLMKAVELVPPPDPVFVLNIVVEIKYITFLEIANNLVRAAIGQRARLRIYWCFVSKRPEIESI